MPPAPPSAGAGRAALALGRRLVLAERCATAEALERVGARLARARGGAARGVLVLLAGDVGAGKTVLARGYVREAVRNAALVVPSPSYMLVNQYASASAGAPATLDHMDLYRLPAPLSEADAAALDLRGALRERTCLVEWPDRMLTQAGTPLAFLLDAWPATWLSVRITEPEARGRRPADDASLEPAHPAGGEPGAAADQVRLVEVFEETLLQPRGE